MKQRVQLYVNGNLLDLPDSDTDPLQMTYQSNDLGNLATMENNVSKTLTIPLTRRNKIILGFPDDLTVISSAPYDFYKAKLVEDGWETIPIGKLYIDHCDNDTADIVITSGNSDFLDYLGGQIADMGDSTTPWSDYGAKLVWKQYDHPWNVSSAAGSQQKTSGWIWPVINYGAACLVADGNYNVWANVFNMRPAFFLKTALETLVSFTGYTIDKVNSCLYNDPSYSVLFSRMLIPWSASNFQHGADYANTPSSLSIDNNILSKPFIVPAGVNYAGRVPFNIPRIGPFTANIEGTFTVNFTLTMQGVSVGGTNSSGVRIDISVYTPIPGGGFSNAILASQMCDFVDGDGSTQVATGPFGVPILQKKFTGTVSAQSQVLVPNAYVECNYYVQRTKDTTFSMDAASSFSFDVSNQDVLWNQPIQCEKIFPSMGQIDLIKYVLQTFGLTVFTNSVTGAVTFGSFKKIVANKAIALDWSDKCLDMGKQVNYTLGNYAQINWLRYAQDGAIPISRMPWFFADDHIDISNKTLSPTQPSQDLFDLIFAPSLNKNIFGQTTAQISDPTATDDFGVGDQPRILIDQKIDLRQLGANPDGTSKTVTFADNVSGYQTETIVVNDIISAPYFYKPQPLNDFQGGARHLCWNNQNGMPGLKNTYYTEFTNMLQATKKIVRYFNLSSQDIAEFNPLIPIYLRHDSAYFYVNKIDSRVAGKPCKVELIRL